VWCFFLGLGAGGGGGGGNFFFFFCCVFFFGFFFWVNPVCGWWGGGGWGVLGVVVGFLGPFFGGLGGVLGWLLLPFPPLDLVKILPRSKFVPDSLGNFQDAWFSGEGLSPFLSEATSPRRDPLG